MVREFNIRMANAVSTVLVGEGLLGSLGPLVEGRLGPTRAAVVSDTKVETFYLEDITASLKGAGLTVEAFVFPAGEATKSFSSLETLLDGLLDFGMERGDVVVALGGGVVGDLAGLAASLLKRGAGLVQVPTTLLSQVDSAIGGKTGINARHGKNLIGTFYPPSLVVADVGTLKTLPDRDFRSGYAEVVKHAVLGGEAAFKALEDRFDKVFAREPETMIQTVAANIRTKARIVEADEREAGGRMALNLGHSFGHALEALGDYRVLSHGEAVAIGLVMAFKFALSEGKIERPELRRLTAHLARAGLPASVKETGLKASAKDILAAMGHDKKRARGVFRLVIPHGFGNVAVEEVPASALDHFLKTGDF